MRHSLKQVALKRTYVHLVAMHAVEDLACSTAHVTAQHSCRWCTECLVCLALYLGFSGVLGFHLQGVDPDKPPPTLAHAFRTRGTVEGSIAIRNLAEMLESDTELTRYTAARVRLLASAWCSPLRPLLPMQLPLGVRQSVTGRPWNARAMRPEVQAVAAN